MNRKIVGALAVLVVVAVAVWLIFLRGGHSTRSAAPIHARNGTIDLKTPATTPAKDDGPAPKGMAPKWKWDANPEGPLRLEGQVVDADGKGVDGAEVWLGSVPPRSTKTEGDGTFAFDKLVIQRVDADRLHLHDLVRQYAQEKLNELPEESITVHNRLADYYVQQLVYWTLV